MDLLSDLRFCFRTLIKNPGFSTVAVSILALGIGVNAAVFTVTNAVLFRGFPRVDPDGSVAPA
jgi:putative ABC transport system permease protein